MNIIKEKVCNTFLVTTIFLFSTTVAFAVCPICMVAVGAGIGLAQYFNVDDTIIGIWIGGLIVSLIVWTIHWLDKKNIRFYGRKISIVIIYYGSVIIPLYACGIMGHLLNKFWGMDKILLGIIIGTIAFFSSIIIHNQLKKKNNDQSYFPLQKVLIPVATLMGLSIIFYYLTK